MSLSLLLALSPTKVAQAQETLPAERVGGVVFFDMEADPTVEPTLSRVQLQELMPSTELTQGDIAALDALAAELQAVLPLAQEFDGELAIMSRLEAATAEVRVLGDAADRELVYKALLFQGYAVARYFQDSLATDPAAAPYRAELNGQLVPKAWLDAASLDPAMAVDATLLPEEPERLAYDSVRAQIQLAQKATVRVVGAPEGIQVIVDGWEPKSAALGVKVAPGQHWVTVVMGEQVIARGKARVVANQEWEISVGAMASDFDALALALSQEPQALALEPRLLVSLAQAPEQPMYLVVPGKRGPLLYEVRGSSALLVPKEAAPSSAPQRWSVQAELGLGWMYDGGWYLSHVNDSAPATRATVNTAAPVLSASASVHPGPLMLGVGVDLAYTLGAFHSLPSGSSELRLRAHPHLAVGVPLAQLTVGYLTPWQLGVGARSHIPLGERFELSLAGVYGFGRELEQADNPLTGVYQAEDAWMVWSGLGIRWGR